MGPVQGSGLRLLPVAHNGNQNSSPEEAKRVHALVRDLLDRESEWIDMSGKSKPLTLSDILIIAPYNAQVFELQERLPGARIGTVDKFQGQEAPIVIYSMTTSTQADAPHGMEFLYSLTRHGQYPRIRRPGRARAAAAGPEQEEIRRADAARECQRLSGEKAERPHRSPSIGEHQEMRVSGLPQPVGT